MGTDNLDIGKLLAKLVEQLFAAVTPDIKIQPSLLLGGSDGILPSYLPIGFHARGVAGFETVKMRPRPFR